MTATVSGSASRNSEEQPKRRRRVLAFGLAGVVAAAGIAGAVVTSSAYFTDQKIISNNSVATNTLKVALNNNGVATALTPIAQTGLVPVDAAQAGHVNAFALTTKFDVKNVGTSAFNYKLNITGATYTKADGSALPATSDATNLNAADSAAKLMYEFGTVTGGTTTWSGTPRAFSTLGSGDEVALTTTPLAVNGVATYAVRFYIATSGDDNKLQDLKASFNLQVDAEQPRNLGV